VVSSNTLFYERTRFIKDAEIVVLLVNCRQLSHQNLNQLKANESAINNERDL
jgi:hypothetical protein